MPRKVFTAGEILTAADVNTNLMDQAVMVFADSTARTAAIPTPSEGMITYLEDTDSVDKYDGSAFVPVGIAPAILQVVSTIKNDAFSGAGVDGVKYSVTGLSATITPSSVSSKILVLCTVHTATVDGPFVIAYLERNGTNVAGASSSPNNAMSAYVGGVDVGSLPSTSVNFLDSPATTSATTYQILIEQNQSLSTKIVYVNRSSSNATLASSQITLMEVAG